MFLELEDTLFSVTASMNISHSSSTQTFLLTKICSSFLCVDDGGFRGQVGPGAPGGKSSLAGVELLSEKLLQLHTNLDEVWCGGA